MFRQRNCTVIDFISISKVGFNYSLNLEKLNSTNASHDGRVAKNLRHTHFRSVSIGLEKIFRRRWGVLCLGKEIVQ